MVRIGHMQTRRTALARKLKERLTKYNSNPVYILSHETSFHHHHRRTIGRWDWTGILAHQQTLKKSNTTLGDSFGSAFVLPFPQLLRLTFIGQFFSLVLPGAGAILRGRGCFDEDQRHLARRRGNRWQSGRRELGQAVFGRGGGIRWCTPFMVPSRGRGGTRMAKSLNLNYAAKNNT